MSLGLFKRDNPASDECMAKELKGELEALKAKLYQCDIAHMRMRHIQRRSWLLKGVLEHDLNATLLEKIA